MCGIVAVVGLVGAKEKQAFKLMLELDVVRGRHSTGIIGVGQYKKEIVYGSHKEAWLPQDFLEHRIVRDIISESNMALIGHNRHATVGAINKNGAHPFEFENVIGVHNGTTSKHLFDGGSMFDVDSEALYHNMNEHGVDDTWGKVDKAASLAWFDKTNNTINFLRNKERPMHRRLSKDKKVAFFASEPWMINVACAKAGIDLDGETVNHKVNELYTIDLTKAQIESRAVTPRPFPKTTYLGGWQSGRTTGYNSLRKLQIDGVKHLNDIRTTSSVHFKVTQVSEPNDTGFVTFKAQTQTTPNKVVISGEIYKHNASKISLIRKSLDDGDILRGNVYLKNRIITLESWGIENTNKETKKLSVRVETYPQPLTEDDFNEGLYLDNQCMICQEKQKLSKVNKDFWFLETDNAVAGCLCASCMDNFGDSIPTESFLKAELIK